MISTHYFVSERDEIKQCDQKFRRYHQYGEESSSEEESDDEDEEDADSAPVPFL